MREREKIYIYSAQLSSVILAASSFELLPGARDQEYKYWLLKVKSYETDWLFVREPTRRDRQGEENNSEEEAAYKVGLRIDSQQPASPCWSVLMLYNSMQFAYRYTWNREIIVNSQKLVKRR